MATVVKFPDALSLAGNISDIVLNSLVPVIFKIKESTETILEETYDPDSNGLVTIRLRDIMPSLFSISVPDTNLYEQSGAVKALNLEIDSQANNVVVVAGGVDGSIDAELFLKSNWLSWQPQEKKVKYTDPSWLSYYATESATVKLKAYFKNDPAETIDLANLTAGKFYSLNTNFQYLSGLFATGQPVYFDIWTEDALANRLSFIQRFILINDYYEFEDLFVFQNSLSGIDTIRFTGKKQEDNQFDISSGLFDEDKLDYEVEYDQVFSKNTGYFTQSRERAWIHELFNSKQKYILTPDGLKSISLSNPSAKVDPEDPESFAYEFKFALSRQTQYLNFPRADQLPAEVEIIDPDEELFFLVPRLLDFPTATIDDLLLFPVQMPFLEQWKHLSFGAIKNAILSALPAEILSPMSYPPAGIPLSTGDGWGESIANNSENWNAAYSWGNHANAGYLGASHLSTYNHSDIAYGKTAYSWGNHANAGYAPLNSPQFTGTVTSEGDIIAFQVGAPSGDLWDSLPAATTTTMGGFKLYSTQFYMDAGVLKIKDSVLVPAAHTHDDLYYPIATVDAMVEDGNTAYSWGNHANAGYLGATHLSSYNHSDIAYGKTAYSWGNHANAGYAPLNSPQFTGTVTSEGDIIAFQVGAPGGDLWDSLPAATTTTMGGFKLYSTQFYMDAGVLKIKDSVLVPAAHTHDDLYYPIATVDAMVEDGNTAYSWGNHANAGYLGATHLSSYNHSDITYGKTAYSWGNHANAGYASLNSPSFTGMTTITHTSFPVLQTIRETTVTGSDDFTTLSGCASGMDLRAKTSQNMVDGFGTGFLFSFQDNTYNPGAAPQARIYARRDGGDTLSALQFVLNTTQIMMTLRSSGNLGIGTTDPDYSMHVKQDAASTYLKVERGDAGYVLLGAVQNYNAIYSRTVTHAERALDVILGSSAVARFKSSSEMLFKGDVIAYSNEL